MGSNIEKIYPLLILSFLRNILLKKEKYKIVFIKSRLYLCALQIVPNYKNKMFMFVQTYIHHIEAIGTEVCMCTLLKKKIIPLTCLLLLKQCSCFHHAMTHIHLYSQFQTWTALWTLQEWRLRGMMYSIVTFSHSTH